MTESELPIGSGLRDPMWAVGADDAGSLYAASLRALTTMGELVAPRGQETLEIGPAALTLHAPAQRLAAIVGRELNPFLMLAEMLWIVAGRDDVAFVTRFSREIATYLAANERRMRDAYGPRLRNGNGVDQLHTVLAALRADSSTRRATLSLWQPAVDSDPAAFAVPCNLVVDFKLRSDGLRMTVFNRSNDLHIGVLFNLVQFGLIGDIVAARLGVPLVQQTHVTTSLHLYTAAAMHARVLANGVFIVPLYDFVDPVPVGTLDDPLIREACRVLDLDVPVDPDDAHEWSRPSPWLTVAVKLLGVHRAFEAGLAHNEFDVALRALASTPRCDWWVLAAEMLMRRLMRRTSHQAVQAREELAALVAPLGDVVSDFVTAQRSVVPPK